jgi:hypothetical protein
MTRAIVKLTQGFEAAEDRVFLDVLLEGGVCHRFWLTQRLGGSLVPHLCQWLDDHLARTASGHHDLRLHHFEQRVAQSALRPDAAVAPAEAQSRIDSIDLDRDEAHVRITLKAAADAALDPATMTLDATQLRQWLGILRDLYRAAGWHTGMWPTWIGADATSASPTGLPLHLH